MIRYIYISHFNLVAEDRFRVEKIKTNCIPMKFHSPWSDMKQHTQTSSVEMTTQLTNTNPCPVKTKRFIQILFPEGFLKYNVLVLYTLNAWFFVLVINSKWEFQIIFNVRPFNCVPSFYVSGRHLCTSYKDESLECFKAMILKS